MIQTLAFLPLFRGVSGVELRYRGQTAERRPFRGPPEGNLPPLGGSKSFISCESCLNLITV